MTHPWAYSGAMKLRTPPVSSRRSGASSVSLSTIAPNLSWIHDGRRLRVTVWPEVAFEMEDEPGCWRPVEPGEGALASAALGVGAQRWRNYLGYAPREIRDFLLRFTHGRMAALLVVARCPSLLDELVGLPVLVPYLASHRALRGGDRVAWGEVEAVHEREGIFGLLQWLGLPTSRQTLAILRQVADPDLPRRLLEPLRSALWEPEAIQALAQAPALTDDHLIAACHALAA